MESFVKFNVLNNIATISIDNPEKKNAITPAMIEEIINYLSTIEDNPDIRCVLLKSNNNKIFSSGYDISSIKEDYNDKNHPLIRITDCFKNSKKIIITAINGHIFGGALEIAISSDFRFFSKSAIFCVPPAKLGIPYSYEGLKNFINCVGISNTKMIFLTADKFGSDEALEMGIANFVCDKDSIIDEAIEFCLKISQNAPLSLATIKKSINAFQSSQSLDEKNQELIKKLIIEIQNSQDFVEGRKAFNEKRAPSFKGK
jgi:enoyl-CoA hydratase/carnithine racemase